MTTGELDRQQKVRYAFMGKIYEYAYHELKEGKVKDLKDDTKVIPFSADAVMSIVAGALHTIGEKLTEDDINVLTDMVKLHTNAIFGTMSAEEKIKNKEKIERIRRGMANIKNG